MAAPTDPPAGWAGRPPEILGEVDSTQNVARRLADGGAPEGTVVWAEHQTEGRGRHGRRWVDEPSAGLLISVIVRPRVPETRLPQLSLVTGVAVAEAISEETGLPVALKWPNDLLIHDRKVAGILAESTVSRFGGPVVILGIGVNVNQQPLPEELCGRATSLAREAGRPVDRKRLLTGVLRSLEGWYRRWLAEGLAPVRAAWRGRSVNLGQPVAGDNGIRGTAVDLAEDGALLVRTEWGGVVRLVAGAAAGGGDDAPGP